MTKMSDEILTDIKPLNKHGRPIKGGETEKPPFKLEHGTKAQIIAKLARDFGKEEVADAIKDNGYTKATQVERHFGVGKPLMSPVIKVMRQYTRLSDAEKEEFMEMQKKKGFI